MKRSSTVNSGAAHHHNQPDAPRNGAARTPIESPNGLLSYLVRFGVPELITSPEIDQRCVDWLLAYSILDPSYFATASLARRQWLQRP
jgi:hypothetical protein